MSNKYGLSDETVEEINEISDKMNGVNDGVRIWGCPVWVETKKEWLVWLKTVRYVTCHFCHKEMVDGDRIPHHLWEKPGDPGYMILIGNPDVVPVHYRCHEQYHEDRKNALELEKTGGTDFGNTKEHTGVFLCIRCGCVVSKDTFSKHRSRCACCDKADRGKAKERGVCWNCGWPYTGEFADYKAPGGLCRLCFAVRDDPVLFGRQLWERNAL